VWRDRHRQAVGRPDRDDQSEVSIPLGGLRARAAERSAALFALAGIHD
jgi:hypothetical protein